MLGADKNTCAFFVFGEILLASTQRETAVLQLCNVLVAEWRGVVYLRESSKQTWAGVHVQQARVQERERESKFVYKQSINRFCCTLYGGYMCFGWRIRTNDNYTSWMLFFLNKKRGKERERKYAQKLNK